MFYIKPLHVNLLAVDFLTRSQVWVSPLVCWAEVGRRGSLCTSEVQYQPHVQTWQLRCGLRSVQMRALRTYSVL